MTRLTCQTNKRAFTFFTIRALFALLLLTLLNSAVWAGTLKLAIQPALSANSTEATYLPLANYLAKATGQKIEIILATNLQTHWAALTRGDEYDMVLEAAHFADYRARLQLHNIIAKVQGVISFSLVTNQELLVFDADELFNKSLAVVPSPSLAGAHLSRIFSNPMRQPRVVSAASFTDALDKVRIGTISSTIVPTALINGDTTVNTVLTTEPVPNSAFSVSSKLPPEMQKQIVAGLLSTSETPQGKTMLKHISVSKFEPATTQQYAGFASLLEGIWGYSNFK